LLVSLAGFVAIALLTIVIERHRHGTLLSGVTTQRRGWRYLVWELSDVFAQLLKKMRQRLYRKRPFGHTALTA
jgi:hypothetical protein